MTVPHFGEQEKDNAPAQGKDAWLLRSKHSSEVEYN